MRLYLKWVNPAIALVVLGFAVWAAMTSDNNAVGLGQIVKGGFGSYFFAKGLFCSSALFILGKILEFLLESRAAKK